jgi:hypothetical protein
MLYFFALLLLMYQGEKQLITLFLLMAKRNVWKAELTKMCFQLQL